MEEIELIKKAAAGDGEAFEKLVKPHLADLFSYAYRFVAHPDDPEDLVQEALINLFQGLEHFDAHSDFRCTLFSAVTETCASHLETRGRWNQRAHLSGFEAAQKSSTDRVALEGLLADQTLVFEPKEHVAYCLSAVGRSLPPRQQATILLTGIWSFSVVETAAILGLEESLVLTLLEEGCQALQEFYDGICVLVTGEGECNQCTTLWEAVPTSRRGPPLDGIGLSEDTPRLGFLARLAMVREVDVVEGKSRLLHDFLLRGLARTQENPAESELE